MSRRHSFPTTLAVLSITAAVSIVVLSQPARAAQIAYEGFRPSFPVYASGGTGFTALPWAGSGYTTRAKSLCFTKLAASEGGSVAGEFASATRTLAASLGANGTTRFISFLIQPLNESDFSFFGLGLFGSTGGALFIGKPGGGAVDQYVIEDFGGANQINSGTPVVVRRTALLVVKLQFDLGDDVVTLYVDPTPGRPEPGSTAVKQNLDLGTVSGISTQSFGALSAIDEIRIGTEYADVVPSGDNQPDGDFLGCL